MNLTYGVGEHSERLPTSTGSFARGQLKNVYTAIPEQVELAEETEMVRLFEASPQLRSFVRDWIMHAYRSYEGAGDGVGDGASAAGKPSMRQTS